MAIKGWGKSRWFSYVAPRCHPCYQITPVVLQKMLPCITPDVLGISVRAVILLFLSGELWWEGGEPAISRVQWQRDGAALMPLCVPALCCFSLDYRAASSAWHFLLWPLIPFPSAIVWTPTSALLSGLVHKWSFLAEFCLYLMLFSYNKNGASPAVSAEQLSPGADPGMHCMHASIAHENQAFLHLLNPCNHIKSKSM